MAFPMVKADNLSDASEWSGEPCGAWENQSWLQPMQRALLLLYQGYLAEPPYNIKLGETTIKKIMALNRRVHLAPQRPITVVEERESREGPKKSRCPFEHVFVDFRYLDAKPGGVQLYST